MACLIACFFLDFHLSCGVIIAWLMRSKNQNAFFEAALVVKRNLLSSPFFLSAYFLALLSEVSSSFFSRS
jgi:hypothetical protein